jgi:hypothetical protein
VANDTGCHMISIMFFAALNQKSIRYDKCLAGYLRVKPEIRNHFMFCSTYIIIYQYNETNVMYLSFDLLRIKVLYIFRALFAHPQEALHKRHLIYCVRIMSVGCYQGWSRTAIVAQPTDIIHTQYTKCLLCSAS